MSDEVQLIFMVNKDADRIVCAGADKDFVDVLFSFLTMPLGTIARLVQEESLRGPVQVGSLNTLYESVVNFNSEYLSSDTCKEMLLRPRNPSEHHCRSLKLNIDDTDPTSYFTCPEFNICGMNTLSTFTNQTCECGNIMDHSVSCNSEAYQGFLGGGTTFIISDNLCVVPNIIYEDIESLRNFFESFLEKFLETNEDSYLTSLEIMTMNVTKRQVLDLLKCSLLSKTALTDFFFEWKPFQENSSSFIIPFTESPTIFQIKVNIVVRKSSRKILYAEGAEDFAEFLMSFLTLPLGGVVRLLKTQSSVGTVDYLYKSIDALIEEKYFISKEEKYMLVYPKVAQQFRSSICKQMFSISEQTSTYFCDHQSIDASGSNSNMQIRSIEYEEAMNHDSNENYPEMKLVDPKSSSGELLKVHPNLPAMFIVTDDLVVAPASLTTGHSLVNRLRIPLGDVAQKNVVIGIQEGLAILKASLTSTSALTNGLSHLLTNFYEENGFVNPVWCR